MIALQTKLRPIAEALVSVCENTYHYWRNTPKGAKNYIIWAEDEESTSLNADNLKQKQGIHGTIDYFTKVEFDPIVDDIQNALNVLENVSFRLNSVQYEDETAFIHHEWEFWCR
jgi:hypothetical protein